MLLYYKACKPPAARIEREETKRTVIIQDDKELLIATDALRVRVGDADNGGWAAGLG